MKHRRKARVELEQAPPPQGSALLNELAINSGLPPELIGEELSGLLRAQGLQTSETTLDQLRDLLTEYLQEVLVAAQETFADETVIRSQLELALEDGTTDFIENKKRPDSESRVASQTKNEPSSDIKRAQRKSRSPSRGLRPA